MKQNSTLKHYLIIGLIISLISIISSCKDDFYDQYGEFYFVNNTAYIIKYNAGLERFDIPPKSTTIFKEKYRGEGKKALPSNYNSPLRHYGNEINIKFNNVKCLINVKENDINSIRDIKNFVTEKIGENHFKFTYTFTEADYNRAVACP